jgi:hypothetical protein
MIRGLAADRHAQLRKFAVCPNQDLRGRTSASESIATESNRTNLSQVNHGKGDRNELEKLCSSNL